MFLVRLRPFQERFGPFPFFFLHANKVLKLQNNDLGIFFFGPQNPAGPTMCFRNGRAATAGICITVAAFLHIKCPAFSNFISFDVDSDISRKTGLGPLNFTAQIPSLSPGT